MSGADPGGGRWGARPPLGRSFTIRNALFNSIRAPRRSFTIRNALFNSIRAPVYHWAPTPGRNSASAPGYGLENQVTGQMFGSEIVKCCEGLYYCFRNHHEAVHLPAAGRDGCHLCRPVTACGPIITQRLLR